MLEEITSALEDEDAVFDIIGPHAGHVAGAAASASRSTRPRPMRPRSSTTPPFSPEAADALARSRLAHEFLGEAFWHGKPLAFFGEGRRLREGVQLPAGADGVLEGALDMEAFIEMMKQHRFHRP